VYIFLIIEFLIDQRISTFHSYTQHQITCICRNKRFVAMVTISKTSLSD